MEIASGYGGNEIIYEKTINKKEIDGKKVKRSIWKERKMTPEEYKDYERQRVRQLFGPNTVIL